MGVAAGIRNAGGTLNCSAGLNWLIEGRDASSTAILRGRANAVQCARADGDPSGDSADRAGVTAGVSTRSRHDAVVTAQLDALHQRVADAKGANSERVHRDPEPLR